MYRFGIFKPGNLQNQEELKRKQIQNEETKKVLEDERLAYWNKKKQQLEKEALKKQAEEKIIVPIEVVKETPKELPLPPVRTRGAKKK